MWSSDWALFTPRSKFLVPNTRNCELPRWNNKGLHCQKEEQLSNESVRTCWHQLRQTFQNRSYPQNCAFKSRFNMSREDFKKKLSHWWDQRRNSASNSQTCTNTMSSWNRKTYLRPIHRLIPIVLEWFLLLCLIEHLFSKSLIHHFCKIL